jgi:hypothetical protein
MQRQIQLIRELLDESQYTVDAAAVAEAIVARVVARRMVTGTIFRNDVRVPPQVRSFRPTRQARSFRPCGMGAEEAPAIALPRRR